MSNYVSNSGNLNTNSITTISPGITLTSGGFTSMGSGSGMVGTMDCGWSLLNISLFTNSATAENLPDAFYPVALDLSRACNRFHFLTYVTSFHSRYSEARNDVEVGYMSKYLLFYSKAGRARYTKWMRNYMRFFGTHSLDHTYLPNVVAGRVNGAFVPHAEFMLDNAIHHDTSSSSLNDGLLNILPSWVWIIANCRRPVYRVGGGWLFTRAEDAAMFKLFDPQSNPHIWSN